MFPETEKEAKEIFKKIKGSAVRLSGVQTVIVPPFVYISALASLSRGERCLLGAQDLAVGSGEEQTGSIGAEMIRNAGARFVIVGHSERRALGETNEMIASKVGVALKSGFQTILCFGEVERDESGAYLEELRVQITERISKVEKGGYDRLILAYEPIWAVGEKSKRVASSHDVHEISIFTKRTLIELLGKARAGKTSFIYGGSVDELNAVGFLEGGIADGLLVGRASRKPDKFIRLLQVVSQS